MVHKISIESTCQSKAKLLCGKIKTKKFLFGENYEIKFKMRNVGEKDFPGGGVEIWIDYTSGQRHVMKFDLPKIEKGGEVLIEKITKSALGEGYALFFGKITANDRERVQLIGYGQELPEHVSFGAIFIETRRDVYSYYALITSAVSLVLLVIFSLLQLIR